MSTAAFDLKKSLELKDEGVILQWVRAKLTLPADSTTEVTLKIPDGETWFLIKDVHGDIVYNKIKHGCVKDNVTAFAPTLVGKDGLELMYTVPYICEKWLKGTFINTDTTSSQEFEISIFYARIPRSYIAQLRREIEFEKETRSAMREVWKEMSHKERKEFIKTHGGFYIG